MTRYLTAAKHFVGKYLTRKEEGATLAEYGLLLALIAVACIVAITALGGQISAMFTALSTSI
jgi:pilus assembly protein Flp/PilA